MADWRTAGTPGRHRLLRRSGPEETPVAGSCYSRGQVGDRRLAGGVPLLAQYAADVPEEGEGPDFEAVRRRRADSLVDGSARSHD